MYLRYPSSIQPPKKLFRRKLNRLGIQCARFPHIGVNDAAHVGVGATRNGHFIGVFVGVAVRVYWDNLKGVVSGIAVGVYVLVGVAQGVGVLDHTGVMEVCQKFHHIDAGALEGNVNGIPRQMRKAKGKKNFFIVISFTECGPYNNHF